MFFQTAVVETACVRVFVRNMPEPSVSVSIVTHNSARYIRRCLDAVLAQQRARIQVIVVDNASTDATRDILRGYRGRIRMMSNEGNAGFAEAQNQAIRCSHSDWVLTLNPDVLLRPGFIRALAAAGELDPHAGSVCGKLLSIGPGFNPLEGRLIDSTGIYFTPEMRHFDRGWSEPDGQRFDHPEYVFGACAAAALYRRQMIGDVEVEGNFFDPDFFAYREDADVAWRAQLLGWSCIYTPSAVGHHVRTVRPGTRRAVSPLINMHSVKNRFLMRLKNATPGLYARCWVSTTMRDLLVVGGCLFTEPRSLAAFGRLAGCLPRALRARREIMQRKVATEAELARWFQFDPVAQRLEMPVVRDSSLAL